MEAEEETQTSRLEDIKYYTSLLLGQQQPGLFQCCIIFQVRNRGHRVRLRLPLPGSVRVGPRHLHHDAPVRHQAGPLQGQARNPHPILNFDIFVTIGELSWQLMTQLCSGY